MPNSAQSASPGGHGPVGEARLPSLPLRIVQLFSAPARLFDALRERPVWFAPLLVGAVLAVVTVTAIPGDIWTEAMRARMLESGQGIPEGAAEGGGTIFRVAVAVAAGVFWFLTSFVVAGFATVVFGFLLGDRVSYRQSLSAVAHAWLVTAVGGLLVLPLRIVRRDPQLVLSVGTFAPGLDGFPRAFLDGLDLFALWASFLVGLAISRFDPRRGLGVAAGVMVGLLVAFVAVAAAFQS